MKAVHVQDLSGLPVLSTENRCPNASEAGLSCCVLFGTSLVLSYLNNFIVNLIMLVLLSFSFSLEVLFISQIPGFYFIQAFFIFFLKRQFLAI